MSYNPNMYSMDPHIAEIYDQIITDTDDIDLLFKLIANRGPLNVFEPFCGTGRILIPLAQAGHLLTGLDQSPVLLERCRGKLAQTGLRARLIEGDVLFSTWPAGFDLVIMGGNCLYELATPEEQEACLRATSAALNPGGYLYLDNNHMEGDLAQSWQNTSEETGFPSGVCSDGVRLESTRQIIWFDVPARLARFKRCTRAIAPNGTVHEQVRIQQKHPVSTGEMQDWLEKYGFGIEQMYGSRAAEPYHTDSPRAIFWARKASNGA